jgi:acetate---CoA ligase (ADP-forming)
MTAIIFQKVKKGQKKLRAEVRHGSLTDRHQRLACYPGLACRGSMINKQLLEPRSIAVIGGSNDVSKPGGKVLYNIIQHGYKGKVYVVNPRETSVQGLHCYRSCEDLPDTDLAIIAVAAAQVEGILETLAYTKNCKAFIIFSSGFGETGAAGKLLEQRCANIAAKAGASLIGPNCIGVITGAYKGVFAGPIPDYDPFGCDCVSASGATMVYLLEAAIPRGLKFRNIFSVGNGAQVCVEDVLQYWDESFDEQNSSRIKLLYMEEIADPEKFLKHARSLVNKGCRIAAIKAGSTDVGERAVASHTGALAGSDSAVNAMFRKAGIIRCYSRVELVYVAAIFTIQPLKGNRIAVITHAGGPGVMLTDVLIKGGMQVPKIEGPKADELLAKLYPGSSVSNPIDFLATGTACQLAEILDYVEHEFEDIDGAVVVFGTTGMWSVDDVYLVLHEKMESCSKPIFPILPSNLQAADEVSHFHKMGHVNFTDEVSFGYVLARVNRMQGPYAAEEKIILDHPTIRKIVAGFSDGFLDAASCFALLNAAGISTVKQESVSSAKMAVEKANKIGFPLVMKVAGPLHKSDSGGVVLNVCDEREVRKVFEQLMQLPGATGVLLQQQLDGLEVFAGAKAEDRFGHLVICGLGGIYVEVFRDISAALAPVGSTEASAMIRRLQSYPLIQGTRGKKGINESLLQETIQRISALVQVVPEIAELDINPLMGSGSSLIAVDARIRIDRGATAV